MTDELRAALVLAAEASLKLIAEGDKGWAGCEAKGALEVMAQLRSVRPPAPGAGERVISAARALAPIWGQFEADNEHADLAFMDLIEAVNALDGDADARERGEQGNSLSEAHYEAVTARAALRRVRRNVARFNSLTDPVNAEIKAAVLRVIDGELDADARPESLCVCGHSLKQHVDAPTLKGCLMGGMGCNCLEYEPVPPRPDDGGTP